MRDSKITFTGCWSADKKMVRINRICAHPRWNESVKKIHALERDRIFCKHDIAHFLDVARIAYIEDLENGLGIPKEEIYAAALLYDIGRHLQYTQGVPHEQASAMEAEGILKDCGFSEEEQKTILNAILQHRTQNMEQAGSDLAGLIYRADKASRACLFCAACRECNWSKDRKNLTLTR